MASQSSKATTSRSTLKRTKPNFKYETDFFDQFHTKGKICSIPATSRAPKKDNFLGMRPKEGLYVDYDISQTDVKLDAGPTKIHVERTVAEYVPPPPGVELLPPPPPKKFKYFHGRGPVWEFLDEKRKKKEEKLQEGYRLRLAEMIAKRKKADRAKTLGLHQHLLNLAGPVWYQELSPKQIEAVDDLKQSIARDLENKTTINVEENMALLGLVPRPHPRHIESALAICCACPVELILILYQLMNPNRESYSINDRLLLSAVVHLTMTETLKELHIRIPSPPPPAPAASVKPKKLPKKKKYKSPYLIPFTFKPEPPKHSGVYKDNHRQYPDCPYFSYVKELKQQTEYVENEDLHSKSVEFEQVDYEIDGTAPVEQCQEFQSASVEVNLSDDSLLKLEHEISKELVVAQKEYNKLTSNLQVPRLHKPSVYIPCKQGTVKKKVEEIDEAISEASERNVDVSVAVKLTTNYDKCTGKMVKKVCECIIKFQEKHEKQQEDESPQIEEIMPAKGQVDYVRENMQDGSADAEEKEEKEYRPLEPIDLPSLPKIDEGKNITITRKHSPPCKCKFLVQKSLKQPSCECDNGGKQPTYIITDQMETESGETVPVIGGVKVEHCDCMVKYQEKINRYEAWKRSQNAVADLANLKQKYIIGGVSFTCGGVPIFQILGVKPECRCTEKEEDKSAPKNTITVKHSSSCTCKADMQKLIETSPCRCKKCVEKAHAKFKKEFIIAGHRSAEKEGESPQRIIEGVKPHRTECDCLARYQTTVQKYEAWKTRWRVVEAVKTAKQKFVISGVSVGPDGTPVFNISGVEPKKECLCTKRLQYEAKEKEREEKMPKKLLGLKYLISGVKESPEENVFIVSGVRAGTECKCLRLYDAFMKDHQKCVKLCEVYKEKVSRDVEEHMGELAATEFKNEGENVENVEVNEDEEKQDESQQTDTNIKTVITENKETEADSKEEQYIEEQPIIGDGEQPVQQTDTTFTVTLEINKNKPEKHVCVCHENDEKEEDEEVELKRFIILDKFPKTRKAQYKTLQRALKTMADDGYPLAKLPNCHELPHFKLWLQLRSGKSWSLEDKDHFITKYNIPLWNHTARCFGKVSTGLVDIDSKTFKNYTYAQAKEVRGMVSEKLGRFYRAIRQTAINDAREFIPTMNIYEFPSSSFRDCLFAYLPTKEEDVFSFRPWLPHEFRNMKDKKICV